MNKVSLVCFALLSITNSCVQSAPSKNEFGSDFEKQSNSFAVIYNNVFKKYNIQFCPKIYAPTSTRHVIDFASQFIIYDENTTDILETCCKSNFQCGEQKRRELNSTLIEKNIRHCECENEFRECLQKSDSRSVERWGDYYFRHTTKCYTMNHPIIKCDEFEYFYQPKTPYKQHPSGQVSGAVRCVEYKLDESKPKIYQTFELPFYYGAYDSNDFKLLGDMEHAFTNGSTIQKKLFVNFGLLSYPLN